MAKVVAAFQQRTFPGQRHKHHGQIDRDTLDKKMSADLGEEAVAFAGVKRPSRSTRFIGFEGSLISSAVGTIRPPS